MSTIIVSGALANKHRNGGGVWERMSWVIGLQRLGFEVYFVEQIEPGACVDDLGQVSSFADSINLKWFREITEAFGVADRSTLIYADGDEQNHKDWNGLIEIAESADLLINLSGHLRLDVLMKRFRRKVYVDVDPGFTQFWHADPKTSFELDGHDHYYTIGENIGSSSCSIPTNGIRWHHVRQPVVLDQWPVAGADETNRFTTVAGWRGPFGPIEYDGKTLGVKVHEFRKFIELPKKRAEDRFEIALNIHPADEKDRQALLHNGWQLTDPDLAACDHAAFRSYVQGAGAEFSVAQGMYVDTNSGWFSDRTIRYLASGKPALVQDTGFSDNYAVGDGLIPFRTMEEAVTGADRIAREYDQHCLAARQIAEEYFDSDKVLSRFVAEVGVSL